MPLTDVHRMHGIMCPRGHSASSAIARRCTPPFGLHLRSHAFASHATACICSQPHLAAHSLAHALHNSPEGLSFSWHGNSPSGTLQLC